MSNPPPRLQKVCLRKRMKKGISLLHDMINKAVAFFNTGLIVVEIQSPKPGIRPKETRKHVPLGQVPSFVVNSLSDSLGGTYCIHVCIHIYIYTVYIYSMYI